MEGIDFTLFEQELAGHLQKWGFAPKILDEGVDTGFPLFAIFRAQCSIASAGGNDADFFSLAIEIKAVALHPVWEKINHSVMMCVVGSSAEEALRTAAERYAFTTLSAFLSTLTDAHSTGFEDFELDEYFTQYSPEGGLHLTTSAPHLATSTAEYHAKYNHLIENPLFHFFPESLARITSKPSYQIVCANVLKSPSGSYGGEVTVNGIFYEQATNELVQNFSLFSDGWSEFDASQTFVLQSKKVVDEEFWRLESKDPISDPTHDTAASCAVEQKLEPFHYFIYGDGNMPLIKFGLFLSALGILFLFLSWKIAAWIFIILGMGVVGLVISAFFLKLNFAKEKFKYTLLTPGVITAVAPLRVLVLAPLAKSKYAPNRGDAFRYLEDIKLPGHTLQVGERIPIASNFRESKGDNFFWGDFSPEPVCWGISKKAKLKESINKLGEHEFKILEGYWHSGRIPLKFEGFLRADKLPPSIPKKNRSPNSDLG